MNSLDRQYPGITAIRDITCVSKNGYTPRMKPKKPKKRYGPVYKKYKYILMEDGEEVDSGTVTYIAKTLERTIQYINFAARKKLTVKGQYTIERVENETASNSN